MGFVIPSSDEELVTGLDEIDREHRRILGLTDLLRGPELDFEDQRQVSGELARHVTVHTQREQCVMVALDYDSRVAHETEHHQLHASIMRALEAAETDGHDAQSVYSAVETGREALTTHIINADREFAAFAAKHLATRSGTRLHAAIDTARREHRVVRELAAELGAVGAAGNWISLYEALRAAIFSHLEHEDELYKLLPVAASSCAIPDPLVAEAVSAAEQTRQLICRNLAVDPLQAAHEPRFWGQLQRTLKELLARINREECLFFQLQPKRRAFHLW